MTTEQAESRSLTLPFREIRDADRNYAATILVTFVDCYGRNPDGPERLRDWWALPLPLHQRLGVLSALAAVYPAHATRVVRAVQESALLASEAALPVWSTAYPDDLTLHIALDAARAHIETPTRDNRAKVRRLSRAVLAKTEGLTDGPVSDAGLSAYHALMAASPADNTPLLMISRSMVVAQQCAKDAGADLSAAMAHVDALIATLSEMTP